MTGWVNVGYSQCSVAISGPDTICPGTSINLIARVTGGNPTTYTWSSNPTANYSNDDTISVAPNQITTYTVQVSGNGCTASATITVIMRNVPNTPNLIFAPNDACSGTRINFSTTPEPNITYNWNFGDQNGALGVSSTVHRYYSYGGGTSAYNATVTAVGSNGCTTSFSETVTVLQGPDPILQEGNTVDTTTFNGEVTFFKCYQNGQTSTVFDFNNVSVPTTGVTSTIIWGDTGANFTTSSPWTSISHTYGIGIYDLTYIVTNIGNGCTDTAHYRVFFGSNAAGGIATLGSTNICGPGSLLFLLTNWQTNSPGTLYQITFNDSTPPLIFVQPPPDSIIHLFTRGSCGTNSSNGIITYPNSFAAYMVVTNPCGPTSGSVLPIYVSLSPVAKFTVSGGDTVCQNTQVNITNQTISGEVINNGVCTNTDTIHWTISPATGWTLNSGTFGNASTAGSNNLQITFNTLGSFQLGLIANNSCGSPDTTYQTICVGTPPTPSFTLPSTIGCSPYLLTPNNTTATPNGCSQVNYTWTIAKTGFTCNSDSLNNYAFTGGTTANSASPHIDFYNQGTYNLTLTAQNACGSFNTAPQTVTIKDKPQATIGALSNICAGQSVSPTSTPQPCGGTISSYAWTFEGGTPATSINQTPGAINFTVPGIDTVSLSVTNECGTNTFNTELNVDTIPVADAGPNQQICSGTSLQIGSSPITGYTYLWSPAAGLSFALVSDPFVTATNNGTTAISTEYYLTVSNGGSCNAVDSVNVTINPGATVNAGFPQNVCTGSTVTLNGSYGGAATSVTWTSNNGGTFSDSTSPASTYTPSINSGTVTLTLTTNKPSGSCPAATSTTAITVIAPPVANPGNNDSMCGGSTIQLGGPFQFGYSYNWSPSTGLNSTFAANPQCTLTNATNNIITQTYTLIVSATGCADTGQVTVSVFPPAAVSAGPPVTVCAGSSINLTGTISGGASSATWSSASGSFNNPNSLSTQFTPSIPSGVAVVILTTNKPAGPCPAVSSSVSDTVNPLATVTNNPLSQTVCSGSPSQAIILTSGLAGTTYGWSMSSPNGVTGLPSPGTSSVIPPQTFLNQNNIAGTVIIAITPTADGCTGVSSNYTVQVNPLPNVILPAAQTVCNGDSFNTVNLSSDVTSATYSWTSLAEALVSGNDTTGTGNVAGQILHNAGTDTETVVYTVVPVANNCTGISSNYTVIVEPTPTVLFTPAPQTICSGQSTQQVALTSATPGATIQWSATLPSGLSTPDTTGTTTIPAQTLLDAGPQFLTIQYTAQAFTSGTVCPGKLANYSATVEPIPQINFTLSDTFNCTPVQVTLNPVITNLGVPDSAIVSWGDGTGDTALYPNLTPPIWNTLSHEFFNNTDQPVVYNVGISAHNLCIDTTVTHPVKLLPNLINAFFTASATSGCQPLTVNFTDESTGAGMLSWCFNYDMANNSCLSGGVVDTPGSTVPYVFTSAGSYTVALYITNGFGCAHDSAFEVINVSPAPVASFTSTNNLCAGLAVQFSDTSSAPPGSFLTEYDWQFGDGDSSNLNNPGHTYTSAGVFHVWLQVTSSFGCTDTVNEPVTILNKPVVAFSFDTVCANQPPTQFVNNSTGALFYTWNFGDGNTSSAISPSHPYAVAGSYQVTLIGSTNSCSDTAVADLIVYPVPTSDFILPVSYSCGVPANISCTNICQGATGYLWNFGDGSTSTLTQPDITYSSAGAYVITLSAYNEYGCMDTFSSSVNIYPIPVINSVTVSPEQGCQPLTVQFSANVINANIYDWNFGQGSTASTATPYTEFTYPDTGTYSVQLIVYSYMTCGDTVLLPDRISVYINPTAMFDYYINENTQPVNGTVQFTNQSLNSASYIWDFGDGATSSEENPTHLFETIDSFNVVLVAISNHGCLDSTVKDIFVVHKSLYVPDAFAPDYTGMNKLVNIWLPVGEGLKGYHAQIFDTWGELLWESTALDSTALTPSEGWNGLYQAKPVQQGTYIWKIDATFLDGTTWEGMAYEPNGKRKTIGSVTLIR